MIKSRKRCNVFLCVARQRDIGEVALQNPSAYGTSPIRALRAAEEVIATLPNPAIQFYICTHYRMPIETRLIQTEGDFAPFQPRSHRVHSVFANFTVLSTLNSLP